MAFFDRPAMQRLAEAAEDRLGVALRSPDRVRELEVREQEFMAFRDDVESLGLYGMDYFHGRPHEMRPERRRRLAQRSRRALIDDPLAGAEAEILGSFGFGKGISKPTARDPKVQDVIDKGWTDANNVEKLTGYQAQRKLSNELLTAGELFVTGYGGNGRFRVGRLDADTVIDIVPDPEDRQRALYYLEQVRTFRWDFTLHMPKVTDELTEGKPKMRYWPHWRNLDDAEEERALGTTEDETPLEKPAAEDTAKGVVYHVAINQTGEQLRGNPPWARVLRFFTAMNVLTESHVTMAQAASTFIARRVMKASPRQLTKAVNSVVAQASELGAGRSGWGGGTSDYRYQGIGQSGDFPSAGQEPPTRGFAPGAPPPVGPGSWWNENESSKLEALNLNSGAGQMRDTAQIVRAPVAAAAQFGQHYLGDASDANLATASTLELPGTMRITGWQKWFEDLYRWFTDRLIEEAVHAGLLGGNVEPDEDASPLDRTPLTALRVDEAEDIAAIEKRTGKDLSYEFSMPFPGRRQLPEVATFVQVMSATMDPNGVNIPLRKILLRFALEQLNLDDISHAVEEAIPKGGMKGGIGDKDFVPQPALPPGADPNAPQQEPGSGSETQQPNSARSNGTDPEKAKPAAEQEWIPPEVRKQVMGYTAGVGDLFTLLVTDSMETAAREPVANGAGQ